MKRTSKQISQSVISGLQEAVLHSKGKLALRAHSYDVAPLPKFGSKEIKSLRSTLHFSQTVLAQTLGVSTKTVEAWESGRNIPQGPAQRMLQILQRKPAVLKDAKILEERRKNFA